MRGKTRMVEWNGELVPLLRLYHALSEIGDCNVSYQIVCKRVVNGWSLTDALTKPPQRRGGKVPNNG